MASDLSRTSSTDLRVQLAASLAPRAEAPGVRPSGTDRMFVSPTGKPMYDHTLWRIVHNARVAAAVPEFRPYDLRHTHASLLIDLDALGEGTRQPGRPDPSTVAITRSK